MLGNRVTQGPRLGQPGPPCQSVQTVKDSHRRSGFSLVVAAGAPAGRLPVSINGRHGGRPLHSSPNACYVLAESALRTLTADDSHGQGLSWRKMPMVMDSRGQGLSPPDAPASPPAVPEGHLKIAQSRCASGLGPRSKNKSESRTIRTIQRPREVAHAQQSEIARPIRQTAWQRTHSEQTHRTRLVPRR